MPSAFSPAFVHRPLRSSSEERKVGFGLISEREIKKETNLLPR
jgi:hypothetical protein